MNQLVINGFSIVDARCNHEDYILDVSKKKKTPFSNEEPKSELSGLYATAYSISELLLFTESERGKTSAYWNDI